MNINVQNVYDKLLEQERKWRIDGILRIPSYEDVNETLKEMVNTVQKSPTPISIELGGLLVKNTDGHIDVYVWAGEA